VRRCYEFWAKRDYRFVQEIAHPEFSIDLSRNELNPDVYHGYDGFLRWVESVEEIWDQFTVTPEEFIDAGDDRVLVMVRMRAKAKGDGPDVDQPLAQVCTMQDGRLVRHETYWDRDAARQAVGLAPSG
jgi:ketosteroid isomerase-like protein